jgi:hypothetical protein
MKSREQETRRFSKEYIEYIRIRFIENQKEKLRKAKRNVKVSVPVLTFAATIGLNSPDILQAVSNSKMLHATEFCNGVTVEGDRFL